MPKVLHVVPAIATRYGGPSAAVVGMCRALSGEGFGALIATTDADGSGRLDVPLGQPHAYDGVKVIFFRRFGESYKWSTGLSGWLKTHAPEFDVVHIHAVFSHSSIAAGRACRKAGVPYIVRPLGTLDPWSVGRKPLRKRALLRFGADQLLTGAAAMHYTSADEQRLAESVIDGMPSGVVVPNGVDDDLFASEGGADVARPYLLSLGRLDEKKGIDLLIEAWHSLADNSRLGDWRLLIAGDGKPSYVAHLRSLSERGRAAARIEFCGWVGGSAKSALLRQASAFVLASHQENFGISAAEALAGGVPAVITPGVNLAADVEEAGAGWVIERAVGPLATTLCQVMADPDDRLRRGRAARSLAERFRWSVVARGLIAMYEQVIVRCAA